MGSHLEAISQRILQAAGQPLADPQPALDLGQQQNPATRGQTPTIKAGHDGLATER